MDTGMMWQDLTKRPLAEKLPAAVKYYREKYGATPNTVYTHPADTGEVDGLTVKQSKSILPGHYWLGVSSE